MNTNIRRFTTALSLTIVLAATTPVLAAPRGDAERDRSAIVRLVAKFLRLLKPTASPMPPIPAPTTSPSTTP